MSYDVLGRRQVFSASNAKTIEIHLVEDHVRVMAARSTRNAIELERTRRAIVHGISRAPIEHRAAVASVDVGRRKPFGRSVRNARRSPMVYR